jgi:hypothetical protein
VNRSVLAALVVACARETLPAQGNPPARPTLAPARLAGVIKDSLDKPIAEAEVFLRDVGRGTRTNARGEFTLGDVPPETYEVWFRRLGYESAQYTWSARAGERTEVKVMLHLLPRSLDPWSCERRRRRPFKDARDLPALDGALRHGRRALQWHS